MLTVVSFLRGAFSEGDGSPSFSRVATGVLVAFSLGWVTHLVIHHHALPDFGGLVLYVGTLYGLNRLSAAITTNGTKGDGK